MSSLYGVTDILSACHRVEVCTQIFKTVFLVFDCILQPSLYKCHLPPLKFPFTPIAPLHLDRSYYHSYLLSQGIPLSAIPLRYPDSIFDRGQVSTRSVRNDLTRSLDSFHRHQVPAHKQQLEPLRRSSPLNQRNRVLSDFEAENENENENGSDDTAVLRFLRKAPKSVKLISGALQQHAESSSPPRRRSSENESNKKLYISKSGVNANDRGQYGKGRITDKGREEKMQRLINSEVFSHENSKADAEVEVEVEVQVIADKFTSSNEIDKLCGEFHSLLSALGGCLSSNENISLRSDEKISTEIFSLEDKQPPNVDRREWNSPHSLSISLEVVNLSAITCTSTSTSTSASAFEFS